MSDESENDVDYENSQENDVYYTKYKLLLEECSQLQRSNEILVFRIQEVNKITKRRHKEVQFFKQRLINIYGEDLTIIPMEVLADEEEDVKPSIPPLLTPKKEPIEKPEEPTVKEKLEKSKPEKTKATKRPAGKKVPKSEKDPNAPKRPANPFFQFCQEQRQILMEQISAELKPGEVEPSKQELTRQLALKWNSLAVPDKKVYVDRYERSKEKYNAQMEDYKKTK
ncbi:uncharacterized protein LOC126735855 [Anthonomus grandis grandis]|uniref:uncharacterized protein LOC126735855 n=1 Tax=Anthonomus grandis grandis TaxID=2921223 RepID=UPI0021658B06|nr:uncharacterized protein LOC126735855 [Anthonomus grandis grandis]